MVWDPTPWFVGGGAEHSAEVARLLAHAATGGADGIITPGDLKVVPLAVPGTSIRVAPGGALIPNRYAGGGQQTYIGRLPSQDVVPVVATGSAGGRSDLVVARVLDPQYEGQPPADPVAFQYVRTEIIQGVPAGTTSAAALGLTYPAIELARIDLPASTATVTSAMITDLRSVAVPRILTGQIMAFPTKDDNMPTGGFSWWPELSTAVECPSWATHLDIVAHVSGVEIAGAAAGVKVYGGVRTYYGTSAKNEIYGGQQGIILGYAGQRQHVTIAGQHPVRALGMNGKSWQMMVQGVRTSPSGSIQADYQTNVVMDYRFTERRV